MIATEEIKLYQGYILVENFRILTKDNNVFYCDISGNKNLPISLSLDESFTSYLNILQKYRFILKNKLKKITEDKVYKYKNDDILIVLIGKTKFKEIYHTLIQGEREKFVMITTGAVFSREGDILLLLTLDKEYFSDTELKKLTSENFKTEYIFNDGILNTEALTLFINKKTLADNPEYKNFYNLLKKEYISMCERIGIRIVNTSSKDIISKAFSTKIMRYKFKNVNEINTVLNNKSIIELMDAD